MSVPSRALRPAACWPSVALANSGDSCFSSFCATRLRGFGLPICVTSRVKHKPCTVLITATDIHTLSHRTRHRQRAVGLALAHCYVIHNGSIDTSEGSKLLKPASLPNLLRNVSKLANVLYTLHFRSNSPDSPLWGWLVLAIMTLPPQETLLHH